MPTPVKVTLTPGEARLAASVGVERRIQSILAGDKQRHGTTETWTLNIDGALGELAAAKALGIYWPATVNTYHRVSDLGDGVEVRTASRDDYGLIIRDGDPDGKYVLVTGAIPVYYVHGWADRSEVKPEHCKDFGNGRPPVFVIPQAELHDLSGLRGKKG